MQDITIAFISTENNFPSFESTFKDAAYTHILHAQTISELDLSTIAVLVIYISEKSQYANVAIKNLRELAPHTAFVLITKNYHEDLAIDFILNTSGHYFTESQLPLLKANLVQLRQFKLTGFNREQTVTLQQNALVSLATSSAIASADWQTAIREITSVTSKTLGVSRVSIWFYDSLKSKIVCEMLYQLTEDKFSSGIELHRTEFPRYFTILEQNRVVAAPDALHDEVTAEFVENYFQPQNIFSLLDAPIRVKGDAIGVVCFEHIHTIRQWTVDDQFFAAAAADLVALVFETQEHSRAEQAMRQTEKLKSLGLLASGIAHDFNNLLTVILSQAIIAAEQLEKDNPASKAIHQIIGTSRQASALTKQLLTYAGDKPVSLQALHLGEFFKEQAPLLSIAIPSNISLLLPETEELAIIADASQIQQVVMNLVINAAEAIAEKEGQIKIELSAHQLAENFRSAHSFLSENFEAGQYVRIKLSDTGSGMTEEMLNKVFEPFFSTKSDGRGLGLATVLGIVRSHSGVLCVESVLGKGTSFSLYFKQSDEVPTIEKIKIQSIPSIQHTVLVVDDTPEIVESISEILEINGLTTRAAFTGNEAVDIFRNEANNIDLILVDMSMPGMNGAETFEQLRLIRADAKVILLSGYHDRDILKQFPDARPNALLMKPYDVDTLLETVRSQLT